MERRHLYWYGIAAGVLGLATLPMARGETWAQRLGYPPDQRVVILHADDIGMCFETNVAAKEALEAGHYRSASAMVPCPWFPDIADWCRRHPEADVGLHLALTSEWQYYRWGPVAPRERVPGLLDSEGYLWRHVAGVVTHAKPAEVEAEIRAQLERARTLGMNPGHLDTHMGTLYAHIEFTRAYLKLAEEARIPAMVIDLTPRNAEKFRRQGYPMDQPMIDLVANYSLPKLDDFHSVPSAASYPEKCEKFLALVRSLPPGLHEIIFHPSLETECLKRITGSWQQRSWEYRMFRDPAIHEALKKEGIVLSDWREVMRRFEARPKSPRVGEGQTVSPLGNRANREVQGFPDGKPSVPKRN